jgi:putative salt-induced outer membrane protein YdiY
MSPFFRSLNRLAFALLGSALFPSCVLAGTVCPPPVVLHLKSGDQVSGLIVSESASQVILSNAWVKALAIPLAEISSRVTNNIVKISPPASSLAGKKPAVSPAQSVATAKASLKAPAKSKGTWHGQINLGLDALLGTTDQQSYSGHIQMTYLQPYQSDAKKFFRNTSTVDGAYQKTDGAESANHACGSNKSDLDLWSKFYAYTLEGAGYDEVQKTDFQYQLGPGAGLHLIQDKKFVLESEAGLDYEAQYRRNDSNLETYYLRVAEDITWVMEKNLKLTENLAFYPDMENSGQYRNEFTSNLSYGFWKDFSLNLTVIDQYNTELTPGVNRNQLELRSSLGFTF